MTARGVYFGGGNRAVVPTPLAFQHCPYQGSARPRPARRCSPSACRRIPACWAPPLKGSRRGLLSETAADLARRRPPRGPPGPAAISAGHAGSLGYVGLSRIDSRILDSNLNCHTARQNREVPWHPPAPASNLPNSNSERLRSAWSASCQSASEPSSAARAQGGFLAGLRHEIRGETKAGPSQASRARAAQPLCGCRPMARLRSRTEKAQSHLGVLEGS